MKAGIYIHIPFCLSKCGYCTFNSRPWDPDLAARYVAALLREIGLFAASRGNPVEVDSIYLGGGTPSILAALQVESILAACRQAFVLSTDCETTMEANPGTLDPARLAACRDAGINRISLGVQSFCDHELQALGRIHSAEVAGQAADQVRRCGIGNWSLDLMLGLPGQCADTWEHTLEQAAGLGPPHVSVYMLEISEPVPLSRALSRGAVSLPGEDEVADWYAHGCEFLARVGCPQYEISNFARPGHECRHNLKYWRRVPVFGFGAGSHSFDGAERSANYSELDIYIRAVEEGMLPVLWRQPSSAEDALEETFFLGLRLARGLDWRELQKRHPLGVLLPFEEILREMAGAGLVQWRDQTVSLTQAGMLLSNEVFQRLIRLPATEGAEGGTDF